MKKASKRKAKLFKHSPETKAMLARVAVDRAKWQAYLSCKLVLEEFTEAIIRQSTEAIIKLATNGGILLVPGRCDAALVLTRPLSSEPMGCGKLGHVDYETHLCLYCLEMKRGYDGKLAKGRQFGPAHLSHLSPGCPDPWHKERGMVNSPLQCPSCRSFVWDKTGLPGETKEAAQ
jgi:hypothetical protein